MLCSAFRALTLRRYSAHRLSRLTFGCSPRSRWANSLRSGARFSLRCQLVTDWSCASLTNFWRSAPLEFFVCLRAERCSMRPSALRNQPLAGNGVRLFANCCRSVLGGDPLRSSRSKSTGARGVFSLALLSAIALIYGGVIFKFAFTQY